ncbi:glycosyltransferase family 2 protein [archaeon]|jgi:glycosyltransferase involved in cell wall biosynthesis|nr:glycosyltransferase family 2 protein [archaeon]
MWNGKKVSVIFPCYNEGINVKRAIEDFLSVKYIDEIVVVDNNSKDDSSEEIRKTEAVYVLETKQGYGNALMRGMMEATGDIIITAEPDNSFIGKDVIKLLLYSDDFDVVFGTRTSKALIGPGAKMNLFNRWGNIAVAKLLEYLHGGPCLTDVGCTMKLIKRESYNWIKNKLSVGGNWFSPEFMVICVRSKLRCVEIPVNYRERIGDSTITTDFFKTFKLGMRMIFMIIAYRFRRI